jgi:predicted RNA-binding protein with PUA-like domain
MRKTQYWLVKQEPEAYSWEQFVADRGTDWTGVRNFQARNNLRAMAVGDQVFWYHSVSEKQVVGIAEVARASFPDPTAEDGDWSAVRLKPVRRLPQPVSLATVKGDAILKEMALVKNSRLSVQPVTKEQAARLLEVASEKP